MRTKLFWILSLIGLLVSPADASIVGRWSFSEGSGTTVADSVGDSHGVFEGNPTWEAGLPGIHPLFVRGHPVALERCALWLLCLASQLCRSYRSPRKTGWSASPFQDARVPGSGRGTPAFRRPPSK